MERELRACPFCGQDAAALYRNYSNRAKKYFVWAECDVCGARSKAVTSNEDPEDEDWDNLACHRAMAAWNVRTGAANG